MAGELFKQIAGVDLLAIPLQGHRAGDLGYRERQVKIMFPTLRRDHLQSRPGKLRALAVTGQQRSPLLPAVPDHDRGRVGGLRRRRVVRVLAPPACRPSWYTS